MKNQKNQKPKKQIRSREDRIEWAKENQERIEDKMKKFVDAAVMDPAKIKEIADHYRIMGLYDYSFLNSCLIKAQGGTICQSFKKWQELGRNVMKGQKAGIYIWRPFTYQKKNADKTDAQNTKKNTDEGDDETRTFFRLVPIFDVTQTEGEELKYQHNSEGEAPAEYKELKAKLGRICTIPIKEKITGESRGYCSKTEIAVSSMSNNTDKLHTLIHEVAHHKLGHLDTGSGPYNVNEVEAETVAHFVCEYLNIEYKLSKQYVGGWKMYGGAEKIRYKKIFQVADQIIKSVRPAQNKNKKEVKKAS